MQWFPFPDDRFHVNGLWWWEETRPNLWRLPPRMEGQVPASVWGLSKQPSGGRIRFATDATALSIRAHFPSLAYMNNMPRIGQMGIDLYVDGEYWHPVFPLEDHDLEAPFFEGLPAQRREICLYTGLYAPVEIREIGLSEGANTESPAPFAVAKPVTYYGSSITQGGCATRPGLSYQAIVSRRLNLDFINLGWSGSGCGEQALAEAMAEIDASCHVIDFAQNVPTAAGLRQVYAPFLATIRAKQPLTPMICITPIFATSEDWGSPTAPDASRLNDMRAVVRDAVAERQAQGDRHITLIEGHDLLGPADREGLVDVVHPNDIGFMAMARGLEGALRKATMKDER